MAVPEKLDAFIREALAKGLPRPEIHAALAQAGWPEKQIGSALDAYAESDFPVPVPRPKPYVSAREAFLYLTLFTALGLSAYHLGMVLFELIDNAFPPPGRHYSSGHRLSWSIAYLVVSLPLFVVLSVRQERALARDSTQRASKVRKWLTYLTLFVAAGFVIGDLVTLIHHLLDGAMTTPFVLKVLVVGVIAGTIFVFYLRDAAREER